MVPELGRNLKGRTLQVPRKIPPLFVVILDEVLVARDVELVIGDMRPDALVIVASSLEEAGLHLPQGQVDVVFVQCELAALRVSSLGRRLAEDGGRVVLVGVEPEMAGDGILVLRIPFTDQDVADVLAGMGRF